MHRSLASNYFRDKAAFSKSAFSLRILLDICETARDGSLFLLVLDRSYFIDDWILNALFQQIDAASSTAVAALGTYR